MVKIWFKEWSVTSLRKKNINHKTQQNLSCLPACRSFNFCFRNHKIKEFRHQATTRQRIMSTTTSSNWKSFFLIKGRVQPLADAEVARHYTCMQNLQRIYWRGMQSSRCSACRKLKSNWVRQLVIPHESLTSNLIVTLV